MRSLTGFFVTRSRTSFFCRIYQRFLVVVQAYNKFNPKQYMV